MKSKSSTGRISVRTLTLAAMLTALSVIIGIFCKNFLNFGNGLFRITFENLPILLAGISFGPLIGALVGAASDLISYLLSTQVYPPNLIVTAGAAAIGATAGLVARLCPRQESLRVVLATATAHLVGSMIIKTFGLYQYYGILVLWRIPLYTVIASLEIFVLCRLCRRGILRRLTAQTR